MLHDALGLAEAQDERLLVLVHDEGGGIDRDGRKADEDDEESEKRAHGSVASFGALGRKLVERKIGNDHPVRPWNR